MQMDIGDVWVLKPEDPYEKTVHLPTWMVVFYGK